MLNAEIYILKMATSVTQKREKTLPDKMQEAAQTYSYLRVPTAAKGKSKAGPLVLSGARNKWETKGEKNFVYQPTLRMAGTREELMAMVDKSGGRSAVRVGCKQLHSELVHLGKSQSLGSTNHDRTSTQQLSRRHMRPSWRHSRRIALNRAREPRRHPRWI